jgi:uncharacterized protein (TIGR03435 family)
MLIALAWRVQLFQIAGGPAWLDRDRFDVEGKAKDPKAASRNCGSCCGRCWKIAFN